MGDDDVRWGNVNSEGGSDEWRSIVGGRMRSIADNTLIDIVSRREEEGGVVLMSVSSTCGDDEGVGVGPSALYQIIFL
jgi:hypothetical protein